MKSRVLFVLAVLAALLLIVDITHNLSRHGPRCDECDGSLAVVGDIRDKTKAITYFRCERCQKYSVETAWAVVGDSN